MQYVRWGEFELKNIIKKMKSSDAKMARAELLDKVVGKLNGRGSASYKIGQQDLEKLRKFMRAFG